LFIILILNYTKKQKKENFSNNNNKIETYTKNRNMIPKIIYKTGKGKPPFIVQELFDKTLQKNQKFKIKYYDDAKCRKFIEDIFPQDVLEAYDILKPGAYKADLFRYCILYNYGGVWSDLTDNYLISLDEIIDFNNDELFLIDDRPMGKNNIKGIQISFMAAKPKNKLYLKCIRQIVKHCQERKIGNSPLAVTGPLLCRNKLNECIKENSNFNYRIDYKFSDNGKYYEHKKTGKKIAHYKSIGKNKLDIILDKHSNYYVDLWFKKDIYN
jgi:mannosyltransferase OCH1-like enzyme